MALTSNRPGWEERGLDLQQFQDLTEWEALFRTDFPALWSWLAQASRLREARWGKHISFCQIINAKSGLCGQDCAFCAQSAVSRATIRKYPLLPVEQLVTAAREATVQGAARFSIVTSGRGVESRREQEQILAAVAAIRESTDLKVCVSLGLAEPAFLRELAALGVYRYHHNVETAASFFPRICSRHTYEDRLATIRRAQEAGLRVCVGGIFGLGETVAQRYEMARTLADLEVDSIPLNFLQPIPGTPLEARPPLRPLEALQIIVAFRLAFPDKSLIIAGGRTFVLRSLAPLALAAGADALMTGDYLTTKGQLPAADLAMLADMGLEVAREVA